MRKATMIILFSVSLFSVAADEQNLIGYIDQVVRDSSRLQGVTEETTDLSGHSSEGGVLTTAMINGRILSRTVTYFGEQGRRDIRYHYTQEEGIVLIEDTVSNYNQPISMGDATIASQESCRYYLFRGELLGYAGPDKELSAPYTGEDREEIRRKAFDLIGDVLLAGWELSGGDELYLADPQPRFNGDHVKALQRFLLFHGMDIGSDGIDGWFGKDTNNALLAYQKGTGNPVTGKIRLDEFIYPQIWTPRVTSYFFTGWTEGPMPSDLGEGKSFILKPGAPFDFRSYFGSITLSESELAQGNYGEIKVSPDERILAVMDRDNWSVRMWDVLTGQAREFQLGTIALESNYYQSSTKEFSGFQGDQMYWWKNPTRFGSAELYIFFYYQRSGKKEFSFLSISP